MADKHHRALCVKNVPMEFTENDIRKLFSRDGLPTPVVVIKDRRVCEGEYVWAVVIYSSRKDAEEALEMMAGLQLKLGCQPLILTFAFTKEERELMKSHCQIKRKPNLEVSNGPCSACGTLTGLWCQRCHAWFCGYACFNRHWYLHKRTCGGKVDKKSGPDAPLSRLVSEINRCEGNLKITPQSYLRGKEIEQIHDKKKVVCTYMKNPSDFWLQMKDNKPSLLRLEAELNVYCQLQKPLQTWQVQDLCAAKFEGLWYRAKITSKEPLCVHYIDYGNNARNPDIALIPESFKRLPPLASRCKLEDVLPCHASGWNYDESAAFEKLCLDTEIAGEFKRVHGDKTDVVLYNGRGEKLSDILIRKDKAKPVAEVLGAKPYDKAGSELFFKLNPVEMQVKLVASTPSNKIGANNSVLDYVQSGDKVQAIVSQVHSLTSFTVVLITPTHETESTNFLLFSQGIFNKECVRGNMGFKPCKGDIVAALSSEFGWNRGVIKDITGNLYKVRYLDYGDDETVKYVCQLPESFHQLPALGARCTLEEELKVKALDNFFFTISKCDKRALKATMTNMGQVYHVILKPWNDESESDRVLPPKIGRPNSAENMLVMPKSRMQKLISETVTGVKPKVKKAATLCESKLCSSNAKDEEKNLKPLSVESIEDEPSGGIEQLPITPTVQPCWKTERRINFHSSLPSRKETICEIQSPIPSVWAKENVLSHINGMSLTELEKVLQIANGRVAQMLSSSM